MIKTTKAGPSTRQIGLDGETLAAQVLQERGLLIIAHNVRSQRGSRGGEIDLIALDGDVLVFIEVKNWKAYGIDNLALAVNKKKQSRIIETAKYFIDTHREYCYKPVRFDIVYIRPGDTIVHLVSAFTES